MKSTFKSILPEIQLLVLDVDGVLTDGKLYYTQEGEIQKVFHVKDGLGIKLAAKYMTVAIISGNPSSIIERRAKDLGIKHFFIGISDKEKCIKSLMLELKLLKENVAFVGDDLNDLVVRPFIVLFACPSDAHKSVIAQADLILDAKGGNGAVRELIDYILEVKGHVKDYSTIGIKEKNI